MSDSLTAIYIEPHQCPSHQSILLTQGPICESLAKFFWELAILKNIVFLSARMCGKQRTRGFFTPRKIILKSSKMEEFWSGLWFTINLKALALIQNGNQRSEAAIFTIEAKRSWRKRVNVIETRLCQSCCAKKPVKTAPSIDYRRWYSSSYQQILKASNGYESRNLIKSFQILRLLSFIISSP